MSTGVVRSTVLLLCLVPMAHADWGDRAYERLVSFEMLVNQAQAAYDLGAVPQSEARLDVLKRAHRIDAETRQQITLYQSLVNRWGSRKAIKEAKAAVQDSLDRMEAARASVRAEVLLARQ